MAISRWFCRSNTKNMLVKIFHPGGRVELHDRPVLAAEVMLRNPRCIVAHPHVFQQPWAIVAPDTVLMLGQKFYVVPFSTIRKLQRKSFKYSSSPGCGIEPERTCEDPGKDDQNCSNDCFLMNMNMKSPRSWFCHFDSVNEGESPSCSDIRFLFSGGKNNKASSDGDTGQETRSRSSSNGFSERKRVNKKKNNELTRGSPKRFTSLDHWQPNLESIVEEQRNE